MTTYIDPYNPEQTLAAIAASLRWRPDLAMPTGNSAKAKQIRVRETLFKDADYQKYRTQQTYFSPFGVHTAPYTQAEANTLRLKTMVEGMSDDRVNKFERIHRSYPNQSPGFYAALIENPDFDVTHPQFEEVASVDLEENTKQQTRMLPGQVVTAMALYGGPEHQGVAVPGTWYFGARKRSANPFLPTGDPLADDAGTLPPGYDGLYGTGGLQDFNEGVNEKASGIMGFIDEWGTKLLGEWPTAVVRTGMANLISGGQAMQGGLRSIQGALHEEGGPNFGKAALHAISPLGITAGIGNAIYGDENFNSAWEQTFMGQYGASSPGLRPDLGSGLFPGGKVAELQAQKVWDTYNLDNQVWSLGVQSAHSLGMDPESSAYHFVSGLTDTISSILMDPTIVAGELAIPSKVAAIGGRGAARLATKAGASADTATKIESITIRGGTRREQTRAWLLAERGREVDRKKAIERGEPETALYAHQVLNHVAQARQGSFTTGAPPQLAEDLDFAGRTGMQRAAQDFIKKYESGEKPAHMDDQIKLSRREKLRIRRGLADGVKAPEGMTGIEADFYVAWTTMLENRKLHDTYQEKAEQLTDTAAGLRRPEFEQEVVSTYVRDVGEQLDLAASRKMGDIGTPLRDNPEAANHYVRQVLDDLEMNQGIKASEARTAMDTMVQEGRFGPLPESVYTIAEPTNGRAFGRINGQDAVVQFADAKRADTGDPILEEAQKILTMPVEMLSDEAALTAAAGRVDVINDDLLRRLNVDGETLVREGRVEPREVSDAFDWSRISKLIFDGDGQVLQGTDLMSVLLKLVNAEPKFQHSLAIAGDAVPMEIALAARRILLAAAKKSKRSLNRVVNKHMKAALADIDVEDLTVEKIRGDILQMTDLEEIVQTTLGRVIDDGGQISYGELLSLAGKVGGHGSLAEFLSRSDIQGIRALNEDGTGIWWADRSALSAGSFDLDEVLGKNPAKVNPLKHNNPAYFLVGRKEGEPYKARTIDEARKEAQKEQRLALGEYFKNIRLGAKAAATARRDYSAVQARQYELQYNAARAVAGMDIQKIAGEGLPEEIYAFLDGVGAMPSDQVVRQTLDILEEQTLARAEANRTLMDGVRADHGIFTDWSSGLPIYDPKRTLLDAKRALNLDSSLRPIMRAAFKRLAKETDMSALILKTGGKWDFDAIQAVLQNAKKTEIQGPDGKPVKYTDEDRLDDFIRIAASQLGHDLKTSVRGIRTVFEPADGPKFARTKRITRTIDRWQSYVPNAQELDLSNKTAVAQRIIDYGMFHKLGASAMNHSLEILLGDGNTQQLSRLALQDALNKTNDAIIDGFDHKDFTRTEWDNLKALVREQTSIWSRRDNALRQTYLEEHAIGQKRSVQLLDENGNKVQRAAHSHTYLNEQINNIIHLPSTADLIGLQRKWDHWRNFIAKTKEIETENKYTQIGAAGKALQYLYLNTYRTLLLIRPAYIIRNLLEMDVRMFLSNSPVALFSHPLNNISTMMGEIAPVGSPLARPNRPFRKWLKETFGMYDQTPMGPDFGDFGTNAEAAEMYSRNVATIEHGKYAMSDERMNRTAAIHQDHVAVYVTHNRWVEGLSHELLAQRGDPIARLVARDGLSAPQLDFLNHHLKSTGREALGEVPQTGETATKMYPIAVLMHEALNDPAGLKKSLKEYYLGSREFEPGKNPRVDNFAPWMIDTMHEHLDSIRTSGKVDGEETPTSVLITNSPENMLQGMLLPQGGYFERIRDHTFGGDQRLRDYIAYGGFHPEGYPVGEAIPDQVTWLTNIKDGKKELKGLQESIRTLYGGEIADARRIYDRTRGGEVTAEASEIAQMTAKIRTFVPDKSVLERSRFNDWADAFFSFSSKGERRLKMGPEFRARLWEVMGDNADNITTAALAESEQAAIRTLSPLRRLSISTGLPSSVPIGRSHKYFNEIKRRQADVDDYNAAKAEIKVAKDEGVEPSAEAVEKVKRYSSDREFDLETATDIADTMAFEHVKDLFYDATKKRNLWYSMRYASMFAAPAVNTLSVWTKLMTENPTQVYKAYKAAYALQQEGTGDVLHGPEEGMDEFERALHATDPNKAFLFKDETGWKINIPLVGKLGALAPGGVTPGMVGPVSMRLENLNFAMQGGSIMPGVSPMVSIAYAKFKGDTDNWIEKKLDRWMLPFGERSILENALPTWLVGAGVGVSNKFFGKEFGMGDDMLLRNFKPAMAILYGSGNYQNAMTDFGVNESLVKDATALAADMSFWQAIGQMVLPARPLVDWAAADKTGNTVGIASLASLFYDDYLKEDQGDYENAMTRLYDDFGMAGIFAITGGKENLGRIPSSDGWDWMVANSKLAKSYDKYIYYFFPADEGDMRARLWMEDRGLRTQLSINEQKEAVRSQLLIAQKAQITNKYVNGVITKEDAAGLKRQAAARFGDASEYEQKDIATPQQFPDILDRMLKEPAFRNTPAGGPAAFAMSWRKYYMDLAEETGDSLGTQANSDLKDEYYARLNGILNQTGGQGSQAVEIIDMLKKEF